jgi:Tol biopolymer transport system component
MAGVISGRTKRLAVVCAAAALLGLVFVGLLSQPAGAAFPGHNGRIAFDSVGHDPETEIVKAKASGSRQRQLTHNEISDCCPSFSANGKRITFHGFPGNDSEIFTMKANGQRQRQLTHNSVNDRDPAFSPNGKRIVFDVNETSIHRMRADGSHIQPVTHSGPSVASADPDWQPLPRHHHH